MMPEIDGFQLMKEFNENNEMKNTPVIFLTSLSDTENKVKAFELGGIDYITKPFNRQELIVRINTHLKIKTLQDDLRLQQNELLQKNELLSKSELHLKKLVEEKTEKIEKLNIAIVTALENANLFNDNDTGKHIKRVSAVSGFLSDKLKCNADFVKRIYLYASLHDIGKVGISENILKKPGKYTEKEFEEMKHHVVIGSQMIEGAEIDEMAGNIVLYHHEKWDGSGYVHKLKGEDIPLEARIVALADVHDALLSERPYKRAFSEEEAASIVTKELGFHFDPEIGRVFLDNLESIKKVRQELVNPSM
jgi:putative two-component system response regulator